MQMSKVNHQFTHYSQNKLLFVCINIFYRNLVPVSSWVLFKVSGMG